MKYFYLIILTLFTATHIDAAASAAPLDEGLAAALATAQGAKRMHKVSASGAETPTHSDAGSRASSYTGSFGGASTIMAKHALYELEMTAETDITVEYGKLMKSYQELLRLSSKTDTRLSQFVGVVETLLPGGIDRASADEDGVTSLQTAFRQLSQMYRTLRKSYDGATGKTTVLETTVSELQAIIATLPPRPTEPMGTEMSPPRLAAFKQPQ